MSNEGKNEEMEERRKEKRIIGEYRKISEGF
jgi:hypothetical protein